MGHPNPEQWASGNRGSQLASLQDKNAFPQEEVAYKYLKMLSQNTHGFLPGGTRVFRETHVCFPLATSCRVRYVFEHPFEAPQPPVQCFGSPLCFHVPLCLQNVTLSGMLWAPARIASELKSGSLLFCDVSSCFPHRLSFWGQSLLRKRDPHGTPDYNVH